MSYVSTFDTFANVRTITPGQRLVLAAISTFTNKQGTCFPSLKAIAERTSLTVRSVQRHLASLISLGFIERVYRAGRSALTRINLARLNPSLDTVGGDRNDMGGGDKNDTQNLSVEPVNTITAAPPPAALPAAAGAAFVAHELPQEPPKPAIEPSHDVGGTMASPESVQAVVEPSMALMNESVAEKQTVDNTNPSTDTAIPAVEAEIDPLATVPPVLLADLGEVRRAKKKPAKPTKTEATLWWAEAQRAGWSMEQVILTMVLRGWSRFEASWIAHVPAKTVVAQGPQAVFVPEPLPVATPSVVSAAREKLAELRAQILADAARRREEMAIRR